MGALKLKLQADLKQHAVCAHKVVTANRAALRLPSDALRDLGAEASKWRAVWQQCASLDLDELLLPIGATEEVSFQAVALYTDNGGGLSVDDLITACRRYLEKK